MSGIFGCFSCMGGTSDALRLGSLFSGSSSSPSATDVEAAAAEKFSNVKPEDTAKSAFLEKSAIGAKLAAFASGALAMLAVMVGIAALCNPIGLIAAAVVLAAVTIGILAYRASQGASDTKNLAWQCLGLFCTGGAMGFGIGAVPLMATGAIAVSASTVGSSIALMAMGPTFGLFNVADREKTRTIQTPELVGYRRDQQEQLKDPSSKQAASKPLSPLQPITTPTPPSTPPPIPKLPISAPPQIPPKPTASSSLPGTNKPAPPPQPTQSPPLNLASTNAALSQPAALPTPVPHPLTPLSPTLPSAISTPIASSSPPLPPPTTKPAVPTRPQLPSNIQSILQQTKGTTTPAGAPVNAQSTTAAAATASTQTAPKAYGIDEHGRGFLVIPNTTTKVYLTALIDQNTGERIELKHALTGDEAARVQELLAEKHKVLSDKAAVEAAKHMSDLAAGNKIIRITYDQDKFKIAARSATDIKAIEAGSEKTFDKLSSATISTLKDVRTSADRAFAQISKFQASLAKATAAASVTAPPTPATTTTASATAATSPTKAAVTPKPPPKPPKPKSKPPPLPMPSTPAVSTTNDQMDKKHSTNLPPPLSPPTS